MLEVPSLILYSHSLIMKAQLFFLYFLVPMLPTIIHLTLKIMCVCVYIYIYITHIPHVHSKATL